MLDVLWVTFPFFALVLCGYLAARRGMLPLEAISGLNSFVLYFALPCMLYRFGASTPIAELLDAAGALTYLFCGLVVVGFVVAASMNARIGWNDAAFGADCGAVGDRRERAGKIGHHRSDLVGLDQAVASDADSVKLLTVHRAKGLEWHAVFLPGMAEGVFPGDRVTDNWVTNAGVLPAGALHRSSGPS